VGPPGEAPDINVLIAGIADYLKNDVDFIAACKGDPGSDANIDINNLPPIRIQTLDPNGDVRQDVDARLGDLVRLKPIVIVQSEGQ
jgi:hypothetical protein